MATTIMHSCQRFQGLLIEFDSK